MLKADARIGEILIRKQIITRDMLKHALKLTNSNGKKYRKLHDILVKEFNIDRHLIFQQISNLYAFKEIKIYRFGCRIIGKRYH